jgi:hypothetical protein
MGCTGTEGAERGRVGVRPDWYSTPDGARARRFYILLEKVETRTFTTIERIKTALAWGKDKHACAFLSLDAETAKAYSKRAPWG